MFEGEKFESRKNKDREYISGVKKKNEKCNRELGRGSGCYNDFGMVEERYKAGWFIVYTDKEK